MSTVKESFCCQSTKYLKQNGKYGNFIRLYFHFETFIEWGTKFEISLLCSEKCILENTLVDGILKREVLEINLRYGWNDNIKISVKINQDTLELQRYG